MQNLGNVYIWGSHFVMSRTDAQNGVDIIFNATCNNTEESYNCTCDSGYSGDGFSCDGARYNLLI